MGLLSMLLYVRFIISITGQFPVEMTDKKIIGNVGEDVVIGCNFKRSVRIRSNFHILWYYMQTYNNITVHAYYGGADRLEDQAVAYQDRTQLFHSEFPNGNASLKLYKLRTSDSGVYQCIVTNGLEQAYHIGSLEVHEQFSVEMTNKKIRELYGEDVVIGCNFTRSVQIRSNFRILWYYMKTYHKNIVHAYYDGADRLEDQAVAYQNRTRLFHSEFPNGNASLKLYKLRLSDEGVYQCIVSNGLNQAYDSGSLEVLFYMTRMKTDDLSGTGPPSRKNDFIFIGIAALLFGIIMITALFILYGYLLYQKWRIFQIRRWISNYNGASITIKVIGMKENGAASLVNSCYCAYHALPLSDWTGADDETNVRKPLTFKMNLTDVIAIEKEEPMENVQEDGTFWSTRKQHYIQRWQESNDQVFIFVIRNDYTRKDQTEKEIRELFADVKAVTGNFPIPVVTMKSLGTPNHMKSFLVQLGFHRVFKVDNYISQNQKWNPIKDLIFMELLKTCIETKLKPRDFTKNNTVNLKVQVNSPAQATEVCVNISC